MRAVFLCLGVMLFLPLRLLADGQPSIGQHGADRYKAIADKVNQALGGQHFNLEADPTSYLASAYVYKPSANNVPNRLCYVLYNQAQLDQLSDDTVAWVLGHELSHCANGDFEVNISTPQQLQRELNADLKGKQAMQTAGFDFDKLLKDRVFINLMDKPHGLQHPSWQARLENVGHGIQTARHPVDEPSGGQLGYYAVLSPIKPPRH